MAYRESFYYDPSKQVDRLRWEESKTADTCEVCTNHDKAWGKVLCTIRKKRLTNGFCFYMDKGEKK